MSETKEDLRAWMRFGQPLEAVLGDFQRVFDAWEAMGVNGIVPGRMYFRDEEHKYQPLLSNVIEPRGAFQVSGLFIVANQYCWFAQGAAAPPDICIRLSERIGG